MRSMGEVDRVSETEGAAAGANEKGEVALPLLSIPVSVAYFCQLLMSVS